MISPGLMELVPPNRTQTKSFYLISIKTSYFCQWAIGFKKNQDVSNVEKRELLYKPTIT